MCVSCHISHGNRGYVCSLLYKPLISSCHTRGKRERGRKAMLSTSMGRGEVTSRYLASELYEGVTSIPSSHIMKEKEVLKKEKKEENDSSLIYGRNV